MEATERENPAEKEWDLPVADPVWLAQHREEALEPDLPIIDPHYHLWKIGTFEYWLPDYLADLRSGHNVIGTIYMEASTKYRTDGPEELRCVGETEFAYEQSELTGGLVASGIVSYANLRAPEYLDRILDAHIEAAHGRLCGIRDMAGWDPDPALRDERYDLPENILDLPEFRASVRRIGERGLVCDLWTYFHQLEKMAEVAQAAPDTSIVINHIGGIIHRGGYGSRRDEVAKIWERGMEVLAKCPNVHVKLGGMGMQWQEPDLTKRPLPPSSEELAERWNPYVSKLISLFGAQRCMFESNFPVDGRVCTYVTLWNAFKRMSAHCTPAERDALFRKTALDLYKIKLPVGA